MWGWYSLLQPATGSQGNNLRSQNKSEQCRFCASGNKSGEIEVWVQREITYNCYIIIFLNLREKECS